MQLLEEDDDLRCLFEAVRGRLGSRRAARLGRFGGLRRLGCGQVGFLSFFLFLLFYFQFQFSNLISNLLAGF
jgi:hypothetical protein